MTRKTRLFTCAVASLCAVLADSVVARAQSARDGFDPGANNFVLAMAVQPDGKIIVGGAFTHLGRGTSNRGYVGRLNGDGSLDTSFVVGADDWVWAVAVQSDGRILIGGDFHRVWDANSGRLTPRGHVARYHADGSLDTSFDPGADGGVTVLVAQPDGKILVGGGFTKLGGGGTGTTTRMKIGRLNADGSVEPGFNPGANGNVLDMAVQPDGAILVGGGFNKFGGSSRKGIARLDADGSLDPSFNPGADGSVYALAVQPNGKILVGGYFSMLGGGGGTDLSTCRGGPPSDRQFARSCLGRLNADGSLDPGFDPGANEFVGDMAVQADGKILVGGGFSKLGGGGTGTTTRRYIGRLNGDGSLDPSFDPGANSGVYVMAVQPDGKILVGGLFDGLGGGTGVTQRNHIGRVYADGSLDTDFAPVADDNVNALAVQPDGKILVGGAFSTLGGDARQRIGRLKPDGSLDASFDPGANYDVAALAVQPDGKILVGGYFTTLGGGGTGAATRYHLGRLNPDGSLDTGFDPGANGTIMTIAVQPDGKILVGGYFTALGGGGTGMMSCRYLGRLNADGSLDPGFNPDPDAAVLAVLVQPDGKILVGGIFTELRLRLRDRIGRLNADGSLDTSFDPGASLETVSAFAVQPDGKILVAGGFSGVGGGSGHPKTPRACIGRLSADGSVDAGFDPGASNMVYSLVLQSDGKILVGGYFRRLGGGGTGTTTRNYLGRLNADGSLDADFDPGANNQVNALAVQSDGKILVGGYFTTLGGGGTGATARHYLGRLTSRSLAITWANPASIVYGTALGAAQLNAVANVAGTFVYTPASGTVLNAGTGQTLSVAFTPTDTANYAMAAATVTINVTEAIPAITWEDPAGIVYGTPLGAAQLNAVANAAGTFVYAPASGTVLNAGAGQTLLVTFTPTDTANYTTATKSVTIDVTRATPAITWANAASIVYGEALGATQLNAVANVAGTFVYAPASGTILNAGAGQTLLVTFTPTDAANYTTATKSVTIDVTFNGPANGGPATGTVNAGETQLTYSGVTYPIVNGKVTLPDCTVYIALRNGMLITAGMAPGCTPGGGASPVTPTLAWATPAPITQGTALGWTQLNATANVPGMFAYSPPAGTVLTAGTQTLSTTFTPTDTTTYRTATASVTFVVTARGGGGFAGPDTGGPATGSVNAGETLLTYNGAVYPLVNGKVTFPDCTVYIALRNGMLIPAGIAAGCTPGGGPSTPTITWANPAPVMPGTALSATQLNATASVAGSFVYSPPAGTVLTAGTQTLSTTFTPTDTTSYRTATASVTIVVTASGGGGFAGPGTGGPATGSVNAGETLLTYSGAVYPLVNGKVTFPDCTVYIALRNGMLIPAGIAAGCTPGGGPRHRRSRG